MMESSRIEKQQPGMRKPLLFLILSSLPAFAEALTLEQAMREAVEKNLNLLAERMNVTVAEARIIQANLKPNPVVTYAQDYQNVFGTGLTAENSGGPPEFSLRTDWLFERGRKREYRTEVARQAKSVAELNLLNTIRQLYLDVQSAYVDVLAAQDSLQLAEQNLKALNNIVDINSIRVKAGDLAQVELVRSKVAALQFETAVKQAQLKVVTAKNRLKLLLGRTQTQELPDVTGPLRQDRDMLLVDDLRKLAIEYRPDLQAVKRDQARSQADIRLQLANGKIDYTLSAMYHRQFGYSNANAMGFFFSIPLPIYNRNQGEILRAQRESKQLELRIKAAEAGISNEIETAYQQYLTSRGLLENIEKNMLEQVRQVREITEYSYRRGEASLLEFLDAQRAFNDAMQSYNDARADYARSLYLIDSTTGKTVNR